jgi:hypothetical protein
VSADKAINLMDKFKKDSLDPIAYAALASLVKDFHSTVKKQAG